MRNSKLLLIVALATLPARSLLADTLPASVRACIGEADGARRLACYDREIARIIAPPGTFAPANSGASVAVPSGAVMVSPAAPAVTPAPAPGAATQNRHLRAQIRGAIQSGDKLIVTLDNGDVWEQSAPATSQLNLKPGEQVQLDYEGGGWFLTDPYGNNIQVRLRHP